MYAEMTFIFTLYHARYFVKTFAALLSFASSFCRYIVLLTWYYVITLYNYDYVDDIHALVLYAWKSL